MNIKKSKGFLKENINSSKEGEEIVCVWNMGSECEGDNRKRAMFNGQLEIAICDGHYVEHAILMVIRNLMSVEIESLVNAPDWSRVKLFGEEFGEESFSEPICREILTRLRGGDKDSVAKLSDKEVYKAVIKELPV